MIISDSDNDKIKYRILVNDVKTYPETSEYTDFSDSPVNLEYSWEDDIILGKLNEIKIEVIDEFGGEFTKIINVIGKNRTLMFKDEYGWDQEKTDHNLEWYARFELGKKIYKHLKDNEGCSFQAEL